MVGTVGGNFDHRPTQGAGQVAVFSLGVDDDSEEQHQQAVAYPYQGVIDAGDGRPHAAAPEVLRRGSDKTPYPGSTITTLMCFTSLGQEASWLLLWRPFPLLPFVHKHPSAN